MDGKKINRDFIKGGRGGHHFMKWFLKKSFFHEWRLPKDKYYLSKTKFIKTVGEKYVCIYICNWGDGGTAVHLSAQEQEGVAAMEKVHFEYKWSLYGNMLYEIWMEKVKIHFLKLNLSIFSKYDKYQ